MGHGASTNTKKIHLRVDDFSDPGHSHPVWNRSNSDGCIVETLNSSKTKVDLLEEQVHEYRDLMCLAEENYGKAQREAEKFKQQLAVTESAKLEFMDRIEELEDELRNLQSHVEADSAKELTRTIRAKDQEVDTLQSNVEKLSRDIKVVKLKCRERLKTMRSTLVESKQDFSMQIYQMKEEIKRLEDENKKLSESNRCPSSSSFHKLQDSTNHGSDSLSDIDPRNTLIVELSSQVTQQEIIIEELREELQLKDHQLTLNSNRYSNRSFSAGDKDRLSKYGNAASLDVREKPKISSGKNRPKLLDSDMTVREISDVSSVHVSNMCRNDSTYSRNSNENGLQESSRSSLSRTSHPGSSESKLVMGVGSVSSRSFNNMAECQTHPENYSLTSCRNTEDLPDIVRVKNHHLKPVWDESDFKKKDSMSVPTNAPFDSAPSSREGSAKSTKAKSRKHHKKPNKLSPLQRAGNDGSSNSRMYVSSIDGSSVDHKLGDI